MSEVLETLLILFKGDDSQLERLLRQVERETADTGNKVRKSLDFGQIGAGLAGLAGGGGILAFLRSAAQESARTEAATRSFENAVKRQNVSLDDAGAVVERLAGRFGLLETDVQEAASILIKSGLDLKTVEDSLTAVGASAASAGFDIATGMKNGAVGIAFGRSEVLETSGVIVNASQGWKTYADSIGVSTDALTDQQKALGFAQAIIKESSGDVEDFDDNFKGLVKSQADVNRELKEFRDNVGAVAAEGVVPLNNALSSGIELYSSVPEPVQRTAVAMVAAAGGATALAGGVGTLALVLGPLAGQAGLFILAAAGVAGVVAAMQSSEGQLQRFVGEVGDVATKLGGASDRDSLLGAATELEGKLSGEAKTAVSGFIEEIRNGKTPVDELKTSLLELATASVEAPIAAKIANLQRVIEGIDAQNARATGEDPGGKLLGVVPVSPAFNKAIFGGDSGVQNLVEKNNALKAELEAQVGALEAQLQAIRSGTPTASSTGFEPLPLLSNAPAGTPGTTAPPSGSKDRTVADVFSDLAKEGTVAEQKAAAIGTVEAAVESLETRARAADSALTEALELGASGEQISYLVGRVQSLNDELTALGERPITIEAEVELARAIELPDVKAFVDELVSIPNPEVQVQITGDPVDIFGVVFDPVTGTTTVGAAPTVKIKAEVDIPDPAVRAILNTQERQILGTGFEAGSSRPTDYGPNARAEVTPSVPLLTSPDFIGTKPSVELDADPFRAAGNEFLTTLPGIFQSGASSFADAILSGQGAAKAGGGFFGDLLGAGLGLGGAALGIPPQISGILGGFVGDLAGGAVGGLLSGGDSESHTRSEAAERLERRGGAAQVNFTAFVNQTNSFSGGIAEPNVEAALNRQVRQIFAELISQTDFSRISKKATP